MAANRLIGLRKRSLKFVIVLSAMFVCRENSLKVPKREIFVTEFFVLRDPIWVGDLRNEPKKPFV
jgi:hypothetical protein